MSAERFTREIKLAAALQHPHMLPVLSAGVSEGLPYYPMPFVRGESLRVAMEKKTLVGEDAIEVLRDVARALRCSLRRSCSIRHQAARAARQLREDGEPDLNPRIVAAVLGSLGAYEEAVKELRFLIADDSWTRRGISREPKMRTLRGNPIYEAFLREREQ